MLAADVSHYHKKKGVNMGYGTMLSRGECGHLRSGADSEIVAAEDFRPGCTELGAVALRTDVLAATGLRFVVDLLRSADGGSGSGRGLPELDSPACKGHGYMYCADGGLYSRLARAKGVRTKVLRRALLLHQ